MSLYLCTLPGSLLRVQYIWSEQMANVNDFSPDPQILIENNDGKNPILVSEAKLDLGSLQ